MREQGEMLIRLHETVTKKSQWTINASTSKLNLVSMYLRLAAMPWQIKETHNMAKRPSEAMPKGVAAKV